MRNLTECQAEVFRRSEKRIKERKQRWNHILIACIPLVLCIVLVGVGFDRGATPPRLQDPGSSVPGTSELHDIVQESNIHTIATVTVSGHGFSKSHTEVADIAQIWGQLASYRLTPPASSPNIVDTQPDDTSKNADVTYTITLVAHSGEKTEFRLTGCTLENTATGETYVLSQAQLKQLHTMLGIPTQ